MDQDLSHRQARREMENDRDKALDAVAEEFEGFIGYNREQDPSLPPEKLLRLIREGIVTKAEIVAELKRNIDPDEREQVLDAATEMFNDFFLLRPEKR